MPGFFLGFPFLSFCALPLLALPPFDIQPAVSRALPPVEASSFGLPLSLPPAWLSPLNTALAAQLLRSDAPQPEASLQTACSLPLPSLATQPTLLLDCPFTLRSPG